MKALRKWTASPLLFLVAAAAHASSNVNPTSGDAITHMNLAEIRQALDSGSVSAEQLVKHYLDAIDANNRKGNRINAVVTLNEQALEKARQWDAQRRDDPSAKHAPLAGIPFLAKDNFDTKGLPTTGGSYVLRDSVPRQDAFAIARLQSQGAILLGKTNMSELAASYGWLGYSAFGGQTLNPRNTKRDPSGSSSGSAAAVAAGFAPFALGTDTSGSVRAPASVTGTVGMRPSRGLISRAGVIPLSLSFDTVGVITNNVRDQAVVLGALAGKDPNDPATTEAGAKLMAPDAMLKQSALQGKTIGVVTNFRGGNPEVDRVLDNAQTTLRQRGAKTVNVTLPRHFESLWADVLGPVGDSEFRSQFERYLATLDANQPKSLYRFVALAKENQAKNEGHLMNPARLKGLEHALTVEGVASKSYRSIVEKKMPDLRLELQEIMKKKGVDVLVFATINCPASVVHGVQDESYICKSEDTYAASYIASATGFPEISVPAGIIEHNLPVGVSFLGRHGEDAELLNFGYSYLSR